jgi:Flp pilus assembly protein TadB
MKEIRSFTKSVSSAEEKQLTQEQWDGLVLIFHLIIEVPFWTVGMILFNVFPPGVLFMMACLIALAAIVVYRDRKKLKQAGRTERSIRELRRLVQQMHLPKEAREVAWD